MSFVPLHPLVPLTIAEIDAVALAVLSHPSYPTSGSTGSANQPVVVRTQLVEPPKYDVMEYDILIPHVIPRKAETQVYEPTAAKTHIFISEIIYIAGVLQPVNINTIMHSILQVIPGMDQYIYDPFYEFPPFRWNSSNPYFTSLPGGYPSNYTDTVISEQIIANTELLKIMAQRVYPDIPEVNAVANITSDLTLGAIRGDYIGGFESFRESNDCNGCCGELVKKDDPWKRYSTIYFRYFGRTVNVPYGATGSQVFIDSVGATGPTQQTAVYASGGNSSGGDANNSTIGPGNTYYGSLARLEGIVVRINLTDKKVMEWVNLGYEESPTIKPDAIYRPYHGWRTTVNPMILDVPNKSYHYNQETGLIQFDNWQMRLSWDYQNGVQLYSIKYSDTDINTGAEAVRSVLYKLGVTEDVVSYSAGNPMFRRNFTSADSSFYPVLRRLIKLTPGVHVPQNATLVSIPLSDKNGKFKVNQSSVDMKEVVAIFEQDGDLTNVYTGGGPAIRSRELVVRTIFSGLFYLWIYDYIFKQDGTIECKVEVTGRLVVALRKGTPSSPWAEYVARNYAGLIHNHIYCYRMDFNIDYEHAGDNALRFANEVEIEEAVPANNAGRDKCGKNKNKCNVNILTETACPEKEKKHCKKSCKKHKHEEEELPLDCSTDINPCGHAVLAKHTHIHTEKDSISNLNPLTNRTWAFKQPNSVLRMKNGAPENESIPRGYALMPAFNGVTSAQYWSWLTTHLGYSKANFFVSKYDQDEQYASGKFPILQQEGVGVYERIQKNNKEIHGQDVVGWYTMAFNHTCHTEDWPFITLAPQKFSLVPHNFFEWNPASTIAPTLAPTLQNPGSNSFLYKCTDTRPAGTDNSVPTPHPV